jgi:hypothetical protein
VNEPPPAPAPDPRRLAAKLSAFACVLARARADFAEQETTLAAVELRDEYCESDLSSFARLLVRNVDMVAHQVDVVTRALADDLVAPESPAGGEAKS